ncbi:sigma-70 family RNA polymerase sigma factor [Streptomyces huasconensis]|uniref:sigma-70 family RNA polymerase sigma factor n=1 Tax=Streptomyces huasconensis TaxID=1854574 RepID=UPI0036FB8FDA
MSGDGRDEPSTGFGEGVPSTGGGPETGGDTRTGGDTGIGGMPARQVPSQGGPGSPGAARTSDLGGSSRPRDSSGAADGPGSSEGPDGSDGPDRPDGPDGSDGSDLTDIAVTAPPGVGVPPQREGGRATALTGGEDAPASDADLIARMRAGDDSAYEQLYRRHAEAVRRYARTCCRDAHTADDLTAEVFARMLQAVRGGSGPEHAVRAYLLTTVRRVAAGWTKSAKREQLVEDFAVFAAQAARGGSEVRDDDTLDLGADVRAMHEAEQSMAVQAFRSLPERWQAVLWHTEIEDESPSEVATLFGLDANGTRVLASRAREGLKQAYLQAHVSATLTESEECARYADRLGAYARGGLRSRAERGLRKHLEECANCRLAARQIKEVAGGIPAVVPIAVIGWFGAAGYAKVAAIVGGGTVSAGAAGAAATGGSSGGSAAGAAASEGLGAPAKAAVAASVVVAAGVAAALALTGGDGKPEKNAPPKAKEPAVSESIVPQKPPSPKAKPKPEAEPTPPPSPKPSRTPAPTPTPTLKPAPPPPPEEKPRPRPTPPPPPPKPRPAPPTPAPKPPPPAPAPVVYQWSELQYATVGDGTKPEMRLGESSLVWQRRGLSIAGTQYSHGVTVHGRSSVTIDLNRSCTTYDALVGVDDMTREIGKVRFSVYADGVHLWRSPVVKGGDPALPVRVNLTGRRTIRLAVEPQTPFAAASLADWAQSKLRCS